MIEQGRKNNIPRQDRICQICNTGELETEMHFMLRCPVLADIRQNFLPHQFIVSGDVKTLFCTESVDLLKKISLYIQNAMAVRCEMMTL